MQHVGLSSLLPETSLLFSQDSVVRPPNFDYIIVRRSTFCVAEMPPIAQTPQFVLFGDSLTEWAFGEHNTGFGWFLENRYRDKVDVRCEGI